MRAWVGKTDPRPCAEVGPRPRTQVLARLCERSNSGRDVNGDAGEIVAAGLALAGMQSGPDFDAEGAGPVRDRLRAAGGACRTAEAGEGPVTRGFDLLTAEVLELTPT